MGWRSLPLARRDGRLRGMRAWWLLLRPCDGACQRTAARLRRALRLSRPAPGGLRRRGSSSVGRSAYQWVCAKRPPPERVHAQERAGGRCGALCRPRTLAVASSQLPSAEAGRARPRRGNPPHRDLWLCESFCCFCDSGSRSAGTASIFSCRRQEETFQSSPELERSDEVSDLGFLHSQENKVCLVLRQCFGTLLQLIFFFLSSVSVFNLQSKTMRLGMVTIFSPLFGINKSY